MKLKETKKILDKYITQNSNKLLTAITDIKPDYSNQRIGLKSGEGYSYKTYENNERDFIYNSIKELSHLVNNPNEGIHFDVQNVFLTEKRALNALKENHEFIILRLTKLEEIKQKYSRENTSEYPLNLCIIYYREIKDIIDDIFKSEEILKFENPTENNLGVVNNLKITNSTINQLNNSSNISNSPASFSVNSEKPKETEKSLLNKIWHLISENKLLSSIILIILVFVIKKFFGIELK